MNEKIVQNFSFGDVNLKNRFRIVKPKRKVVTDVVRNIGIVGYDVSMSYNLRFENGSYRLTLDRTASNLRGKHSFGLFCGDESFFPFMKNILSISLNAYSINGGVVGTVFSEDDMVFVGNEQDGTFRSVTLDFDKIETFISVNPSALLLALDFTLKYNDDTFIHLDNVSIVLGRELPLNRDLFTLDGNYLHLVGSPVLDTNNLYVQPGDYLIDPNEVYYLLEKIGG